MILAYKAFNEDLTCTLGKGKYQYEEGVWLEEKEANIRKGGFHCAENPLDCLTYYDFEKAVIYLVAADGDMNEDGGDTAITCTKIKLIQKLDSIQFVAHALKYLYEHPYLPENVRVQKDEAIAVKNFVIVRGKNPKAKGKRGTILGFAKEYRDTKEIEELGTFVVGEDGLEEDCYYDARGKKVAE